MPYITQTTADGPLNSQLQSFLATAEAQSVKLGLTAPDIEAMGELYTAFSTSLAASDTAKAASKAATTAKNTAKRLARANVSAWAKIWRADENISDDLLNELMLAPHNTPGQHSAPTTPTDVTASLNNESVITLKWKRNGNTSGTIFSIETAEDGSGPWTMLDATTKTKFSTQGTPGTTQWFRIVAKRDGMSATPTNPISVWTGGQSLSLQIAA